MVLANLNFLREHLYPFVDNLVDLGHSLTRWRKIWTRDIDIVGTGTASKTPTVGTDIVNKTYADGLVNMTVEEVDGTPSYTGINTWRFDQADGFVVTNPSAGVARIDMTTSAGISEVREVDLTPTVSGVTKLEFDQTDGFVVTEPIAGTVRVDITAIPDANLAAIAATKVTGTFDQLGAALTGSLAVADGGTGAATSDAARTNLVAAKQLAPVALTPAAIVTLDASLGDTFTLTADQNFTLQNPTNPTNGQRIIIRIKQDVTGSRLITFDTAWRFGTDITAVVLTTTASKLDYIGAYYNSTDTKWDIIAFTKGF